MQGGQKNLHIKSQHLPLFSYTSPQHKWKTMEIGGRMEPDLTPVLMSKTDTLPHIIYHLQHSDVC